MGLGGCWIKKKRWTGTGMKNISKVMEMGSLTPHVDDGRWIYLKSRLGLCQESMRMSRV